MFRQPTVRCLGLKFRGACGKLEGTLAAKTKPGRLPAAGQQGAPPLPAPGSRLPPAPGASRTLPAQGQTPQPRACVWRPRPGGPAGGADGRWEGAEPPWVGGWLGLVLTMGMGSRGNVNRGGSAAPGRAGERAAAAERVGRRSGEQPEGAPPQPRCGGPPRTPRPPPVTSGCHLRPPPPPPSPPLAQVHSVPPLGRPEAPRWREPIKAGRCDPRHTRRDR